MGTGCLGCGEVATRNGVACAKRCESICPVKEAGKIIAYVCGVLVLGALLAPPLWWAAHAMMGMGFLLVLQKFGFQKYFNRSALVAALVLLKPLVGALGLRGWRPPLFARDTHWARRMVLGVALGAGAMAVLAGVYLWAGAYVWKGEVSWREVGAVLASAVVVGVLEESVFRGVLGGLVERGMGVGREGRALWVTSGLFAALHFLKPDPSLVVGEVFWWSGFALLPHLFHQFTQPLLLLGGFGTLLVFGLLLGLAARRTGSLWMSIGLHGGLVLVKGLFSKGADRAMEWWPWSGPELQVGLLPVLVLFLVLGLVWVLTRESRVEERVSRVDA